MQLMSFVDLGRWVVESLGCWVIGDRVRGAVLIMAGRLDTHYLTDEPGLSQHSRNRLDLSFLANRS